MLRYIERVDPSATFPVALGRLIRASMEARPGRVTTHPDGRVMQRFRGPPPERLRLVVVPPAAPTLRPDLVTVMPKHDRWKAPDAARLAPPHAR